ncbi:MAG: DUF438 domain-containing protein [Candidatus Hydrogenedentes bacterium]|nr:DUF438 domain-containing protein [Candidatus Hydrogenedentota bacterium]
MKLDANTRVGKLVDDYPFLLDTLAEYSDKFSMLRNPLLRKTVGQFATLAKAAQLAGVDLTDLLNTVAAAIHEETGEPVEIEAAAADALDAAPGMDPGRIEKLKAIIQGLHEGKAVDLVRQEFAELIQNVDPAEIAAMEQQLIQDGLPEEEIRRLCDVHVAVFRQSLDQSSRPQAPPGHPVHTFQKENAAIAGVIAEIRRLLSEPENIPADALAAQFEQLAQIENHYLRKENQLFPFMEKYGVTAPPKVMWAIHDDIRAQLKALRAAIHNVDTAAVRTQSESLLTTIQEMIYKEENILFPLCLQLLSEEDWRDVYQGEEDIGYALVQPEATWKPSGASSASGPASGFNALPLDTGLLTLEQVNLMLTHLPVDISFVDEHDVVRYYSEAPKRIFPRSPGVIGRKVQNCHPPKSLHLVTRILEEFRAGNRDVAEFWIEIGDRFIHIRYYAMRTIAGQYKGCLEVSQDVTGIRALTGQRRLLDWE